MLELTLSLDYNIQARQVKWDGNVRPQLLFASPYLQGKMNDGIFNPGHTIRYLMRGILFCLSVSSIPLFLFVCSKEEEAASKIDGI